MKSKKLFAILTLVMFMMTLLPMAAFAANRFASSVAVDKEDVVADASDFAKVTVYVAEPNGQPSSGATVYIATDRGIEDIEQYDTDNDVTSLTTGADGTVKFEVKASVAGTAKLGVGLTNLANLKAFLEGQDGSSAATAGLIGEIQTINFQSAPVNTVTLTPAVAGLADGVTKTSVVATVLTAGGTPVNDEAVTFTVSKTGLTFDKTSYTTDAFGKVTAKVTTTKAGIYAITAKAGGKTSAAVDYTFNASGTAYAIEMTKSPTTPVAKGVLNQKVLKFKVTDINGNRIKTGDPIDATVEDKPTGGTATVALNATSVDSNGDWQYDINLSKAGDYKLRFALDNGKLIDVVVTAATQGDIVKIEVSYDQSTLAITSAPGNETDTATIKKFDAAGVSVSDASNVVFSISNPALASIGADGLVKTVTTDTKDACDLTVTAIDTVNNLVATTVIKLTGTPIGFTATPPASVDVNTDAVVNIQFVDKDGKSTSLGQNAGAIAKEYTIISKPADAGINVSFAGTADTDLKDKGATTVKISSTKQGDVTVQLRITVGGVLYTTPVTVKVATAAPQTVGAKVTMFIGATGYVQDGAVKVMDVAPFIKDGRTFVAVRPIADAFGCEIGWNEATQTVTLTRADITVTIVIGSNTITVVKDGVTTTVTADVPAFIKDGRTVLPFRAVGDAFGVPVSYDAASQSVSYN